MNKSNSVARYVAFDTNMYVLFAGLHNRDKITREFFEHHLKLKSLILIYEDMFLRGEVTPVILPAVYTELLNFERKHDVEIFKHLKQYNCVLLKAQNGSFVREVANLTKQYSTPVEIAVENRFNFVGSQKKYYKKATFALYKNKALGIEEYATDAIIMAQSTVAGLPIVSNDKHFIFNNTPLLVEQINMENGYGKDCIPYSPQEYLLYISKYLAPIGPQQQVKKPDLEKTPANKKITTKKKIKGKSNKQKQDYQR